MADRNILTESGRLNRIFERFSDLHFESQEELSQHLFLLSLSHWQGIDCSLFAIIGHFAFALTGIPENTKAKHMNKYIKALSFIEIIIPQFFIELH